MAANPQPPPQICERDGCERKGCKLRHNTTRLLGVKGSDPQHTVPIHVFLCEAFGPQLTLHTQKVGPHGERLEKLPGFAHYRFTDAVSREIIETERRRGKRRLSRTMRARIAEAKAAWWANPQNKEQAIGRISEKIKAAWADPRKRANMEEANRRKSASPAYRRRMSKAQRLALKDPVKRHNRSEGPRGARVEERAILQTAKAAGITATSGLPTLKATGGRPRKNKVRERIRELRGANLSWAQVATKLNDEMAQRLTPDAYRNLMRR